MPFRINTPDVTHELLDGEVIVVHVVTGAYYSLGGPAATIWGWLDRGAEIEAMCNRIVELNGADRESIGADLHRFTADLQAEGLISSLQPANGARVALDDTADEAIVPFRSPKFEKYSDMEELLLVDPIHEVSPQGWPEKLSDNP
jgi:hypothetical protein